MDPRLLQTKAELVTKLGQVTFVPAVGPQLYAEFPRLGMVALMVRSLRVCSAPRGTTLIEGKASSLRAGMDATRCPVRKIAGARCMA
jgi:hypothetical protein